MAKRVTMNDANYTAAVSWCSFEDLSGSPHRRRQTLLAAWA